MKRIIFFNLIGPNYPGGCENYFAKVIGMLSKKRHKTLWIYSSQFNTLLQKFYQLLYRSKKPTAQYVRDKVKGETKDFGILSFFPFGRNFCTLKKYLVSADKIYVKNEFLELLILYTILGKRLYSDKVIIGVHSAIFIPNEIKGLWKFIHDIEYNSLFYKTFLKNAFCIHIPNEDYKSLLKENYNICESRSVYIPHPIDWQTAFVKKISQQSFSVLWVGRLSKLKGVDRLALILKKLADEHPKEFTQMNFSIASEGGEEIILMEHLTKKYKNVHYLQFVQKMKPLYEKTVLTLGTSYFETFGYSILESQSFGVPVISFDAAGAKTIIEEGKTGWIVKSVPEAVKKIVDLYYTFTIKRATFNAIREYTFNRTKRVFSKPIIYRRLENLLTD